jgi:multiple sugar transport system permease protein
MHAMTAGFRLFGRQLWKDRYAYFFLTPGYFVFLALVFLPLVAGIWVSFFTTDFITFKWVGVGNYRTLLTDRDFLRVMHNTVTYVGILVPVTTVVSLLISFLIQPLAPAMQSFFRGAFYLPGTIGGIVLTTVWLWIFDPTFGVANYLLGLVGIKPVLWLASAASLYAVCIVVFFMNLGTDIILFLAGLANIPPELTDAAQVDGAPPWRVIWHVTLPLLRPVLAFVVATQTIAFFQIWETIYILTNGGPFNASASVVFFIFQTAFRYSRWGLGAAMGVALMIIIVAITLVQLRYWGEVTTAEA